VNAALLRKELRDLLPWGILGLALGVSHIVEQALTQLDLTPLGRTFYLLTILTSSPIGSSRSRSAPVSRCGSTTMRNARLSRRLAGVALAGLRGQVFA